jgi:DNA-binding transcriptional LysR family regulator
MDVRELRYFAAVFLERNLTQAAQRCFISQPSISTAIANLEAELGTTLFIRHKKGVAPTAAAEQLYSVARRIIDEVDAARNLFRRPAARPQLTLALMRTLDLPRTVALLKPLTGQADVALRLVGLNEVADARIISKSQLRADERFVPLWIDRYVAALPPSHPLTLKQQLRTSDFAGVAMIDRCHCEQSEFFKRSAQSRQTVAVAESEDWAMALVAAGVGVAIVPEGVARAHPDVVVREIEVDVKRQVGLAYSAARPPSDVLQKLIASVRKQRPVSGRSGREAAIARPGKRRTEVKLKRHV